MELKLLRLLYGILFFVTPLLIVPTTSELFEFNKMLLIYTIAVISFFLFALHAIRTNSWLVKRTFFAIPLVLFLGSQIVSTLFSIDPHTSIMGYYGRFNGGLISLGVFAALATIAAAVFTKTDVLRLIKLSVVSSFAVMLWGLPSKMGRDLTCWLFTQQLDNTCWTDQFKPSERMFSTLGQPNWLGSFLAFNFFFALIFLIIYITNKQKRMRLVTAAYLLLSFACILFTKSRSSLIALAAGGAIFTAMMAFIKPVRESAISLKKPILVFVALACILFFNEYVGFGWVKAPNPTIQSAPGAAVAAPTVVTESLDIRKIVWQGALDLGLKYPLFGTGPETFAYSYYSVRPVQHNATSEWDFIYNKAHNEFLNYLATTGFVGLISYLVFVGSVYFYLIKQFITLRAVQKPTHHTTQDLAFYAGLTAAFTTIHITNFFGFSTSTINLALFLIPALAYSYSQKKESVRTPVILLRDRLALLGVVLAASLYGLIWLASFHVADLKYAQANEKYAQGEYYLAVGALQDALKLHYEHLYEDKLSTVFANLALVAPFQDNDPNKPGDYIQFSNSANLRTLQKSPQNVQYWKTRGKNEYLYYQSTLETSYLDEAIKSIETAKKLAPTDPKYPYTQALFLSLRADEEKNKSLKAEFELEALDNSEQAMMLKPDYIDARILTIKLLEKYGQADRAAELREILQREFPYATSEAE